jgi:hypothetical protein
VCGPFDSASFCFRFVRPTSTGLGHFDLFVFQLGTIEYGIDDFLETQVMVAMDLIVVFQAVHGFQMGLVPANGR